MFKNAQDGMAEALAPFVAEFVGTFVLAFTYGVCTAIGDETWNATAVASALVAVTYGLAPISGGYFNPAVALSNWLSGRLLWKRTLMYIVVQILAGLAAGLANFSSVEQGDASKVGAGSNFSMSQACVAEAIYTAMLCLAHLSCVTCLRNNPAGDENHFSGLAVGFVVIAGGYSVTDISGAIFNPAIALGLDTVGKGASGSGPLQFAGFHLVGAVLAAVLFRLCWGKEPVRGRTLQVRIMAVRHLKRHGSGFLGDTPDPYVVARWGQMEKRTATVKNTLNPTWSTGHNEFFIGGGDIFQEPTLRFEVMNDNMAKDSSLGHLDVDLSHMPLGAWQHMRKSLAEGQGADLEVQVMMMEEDLVADQAHHGSSELRLGNRLMCELLGTFLVVLTMGLSAITGSKVAPWSVAAALMTMVYSLGFVSGGHFNPAVTLGVVLSGRGVCGFGRGVAYWIAQMTGGVLAGYACATFQPDSAKKHPFELGSVSLAEVLFTFMLVLVVLAVATAHLQPSVTAQNLPVGLAIGSCVVAGGFSTGSVMNPAASWGLAAATAAWTGTVTSVPLFTCASLSTLELVGSILAAVIFRVTYASAYHVEEEEAKEYAEEY